jgi:hypothetical protein
MIIILVNNAASEYPLDVAHADILVLDFLVDEVCCPDLDPVVVDGDKLGVRVVVEADLVGSICTDWVATQGFSC